jgi:hypothetical protein
MRASINRISSREAIPGTTAVLHNPDLKRAYLGV